MSTENQQLVPDTPAVPTPQSGAYGAIQRLGAAVGIKNFFGSSASSAPVTLSPDQYTATVETIESLKNSNASLTQSNKDIQAQVDDLTSQVASRDTQIAALEEQVVALTPSKSGEEGGEQDPANAEAATQLAALQTEFDAMKVSLTAAQDQVAAKDLEITKLTDQKKGAIEKYNELASAQGNATLNEEGIEDKPGAQAKEIDFAKYRAAHYEGLTWKV